MPSPSELWLYHPKPLADELISSWLVRIAHGHGMKLQTFSRVSLGKGQDIWLRDVDRQAPDWLVRKLSKHTGVGVRRIRQSSLLAYKRVLYARYKLTGHQNWILPLNFVNTSYRNHGLQYCPQCLSKDEVPYFRKRWRISLYTICTEHKCMLYDRCPSCSAVVQFTRREMGKFSQVDAGLITQCHACNFDLRDSKIIKPTIYDESSYLAWLPILKMLEGEKTDARYNLGFFSVLHQLCKLLVGHMPNLSLQKFVATKINAPEVSLLSDNNSFEKYSLERRHIIIQLAMWLMASPEVRIVEAWHNKAVRYNMLNKDFNPRPQWYRDIVLDCANWRAN